MTLAEIQKILDDEHRVPKALPIDLKKVWKEGYRAGLETCFMDENWNEVYSEAAPCPYSKGSDKELVWLNGLAHGSTEAEQDI